MSTIKRNVLRVLNVALELGKQNEFKDTILEKEPHLQDFIRKAKVQYKPLKERSEIVTVLRHHCRLAVEDLIKESYTKSVCNLLNEFYEIFSTDQIKKLSKVKIVNNL